MGRTMVTVVGRCCGPMRDERLAAGPLQRSIPGWRIRFVRSETAILTNKHDEAVEAHAPIAESDSGIMISWSQPQSLEIGLVMQF